MYKIIVCDDNKSLTEVMVTLLRKYTNIYDIDVVGFISGHEVLEYCRQNKCDIIYMDVKVGEENGMTIAKTLKIMNPQLLVIYISAYDNYYVDMVQAEPFRFIDKNLKDIGEFEKQILNTLDLAVKRIVGNDIFSYEVRKKQYNIELSKVYYFYSIARKIYIEGKVVGVPNSFYGRIDELQDKLAATNDNFIRISKSYIINLRYTGKVFGKHQVSVGNKILSVTPKYRDMVQQKIISYWIL